MNVSVHVSPGKGWWPAQGVPCFMHKVSWDWFNVPTTLMDSRCTVEYGCMHSHVGYADISRHCVSQLRVSWQFATHACSWSALCVFKTNQDRDGVYIKHKELILICKMCSFIHFSSFLWTCLITTLALDLMLMLLSSSMNLEVSGLLTCNMQLWLFVDITYEIKFIL